MQVTIRLGTNPHQGWERLPTRRQRVQEQEPGSEGSFLNFLCFILDHFLRAILWYRFNKNCSNSVYQSVSSWENSLFHYPHPFLPSSSGLHHFSNTEVWLLTLWPSPLPLFPTNIWNHFFVVDQGRKQHLLFEQKLKQTNKNKTHVVEIQSTEPP